MNHIRNTIALGWLVIALVLALPAAHIKESGTPVIIGSSISRVTGGSVKYFSADTSLSDTSLVRAPEFAPGAWINSEPLTVKSLAGRVVLVEFWTFGCYNCRNTLPYLKRWHEIYCDKGLTVVGVHSPEFDREKKIENVRREVASLGIDYPVVTDNNFETWKAYKVEAWPTIFVLDKLGRVRWMHVGEGAYDETERTIRELLAEQR